MKMFIMLLAISSFSSAFAQDYCRNVVDATLVENETILNEIERIEVKTPADIAKVESLVEQVKKIEAIQLAIKAYCPNF